MGVVAAVMLTVALSKLEARPPSVARAEVIIDSVRRGPLIRRCARRARWYQKTFATSLRW